MDIESLLEESVEDWDSPHNSEWILGVDIWGVVFIVKAPNIHPSFLEDRSAEMVGFHTEVNEEAGLYKAVCDYYVSTCWETGTVDDWEFEIKRMDKIA